MPDADEAEWPEELRQQVAIARQVMEKKRAEEEKKRLEDSRYAVKFWSVIGIVCVVLIYACSESPKSSYRSSPGGDGPSQQVYTPRGDW